MAALLPHRLGESGTLGPGRKSHLSRVPQRQQRIVSISTSESHKGAARLSVGDVVLCEQ